ncbi:unnamed protein product, partial [Nesidiocoris tenuis]
MSCWMKTFRPSLLALPEETERTQQNLALRRIQLLNRGMTSPPSEPAPPPRRQDSFGIERVEAINTVIFCEYRVFPRHNIGSRPSSGSMLGSVSIGRSNAKCRVHFDFVRFDKVQKYGKPHEPAPQILRLEEAVSKVFDAPANKYSFCVFEGK